MDHEALDVGDVGEQREELQVVDELPRGVLTALDLEGEDRGTAVGEVLLVEVVVGVVGETRVVDLLDVRVVHEVLDDLLGVLGVALEAKRQGLGALEQQERVEGRDAGALVAEEDRADVGHVRGGTAGVGEGDAVVGGVGLGDLRILARGLPIEVTTVDDHAAKRGAVAADELRGGVDNDVSAVLERTEEIRRAKRVVHDDGQAVLVGNLGDGVDVGDVGVGVAEGLEVDEGGVVLDGRLDLVEVVGVDEGGRDAVLRERVLEQVVGAAIDGLLGDHMIAGLGERLDGVGDGGGAGGDSETGHATLERGDAVLEDALRGVGQAAVDVAGIGEAEAVGGVLGVTEDVARGLVDGHGTGVGGGIGRLLADVELKGLEVEGLLGLGGDVRHGFLLKDGSCGMLVERVLVGFDWRVWGFDAVIVLPADAPNGVAAKKETPGSSRAPGRKSETFRKATALVTHDNPAGRPLRCPGAQHSHAHHRGGLGGHLSAPPCAFGFAGEFIRPRGR